VWFDNILVLDLQDHVTHIYDNGLFFTYVMGWDSTYNNCVEGGGQVSGTFFAPNDFHMDDMYLDNTLARVEIAEGNTWASKGHYEVQPPVTWSSTSITFPLNVGSFTSGQTVYVYVVDSDGNASAPKEITLP